MTAYSGEPGFQHDSTDRTGVLLVNLGTPDAPTPGAVRRFLAQFLWDPRVVEAPRWLWWLALHGVILRIRPRRSAHAYRQIWTDAGSPLLVHSTKLAAELQQLLASSHVRVALGMTYGNPSIPSALERLRAEGARRVLVIPLYPQYSGTTTASVFDSVSRVLRSWRWVPEVRFVGSYYELPSYVDGIAQSIADHWREHERTHLVFSFHGLPRRYLLNGDPYHCQCRNTARRVAERLDLAPADWSVGFQSQVGTEEWLRPYTDQLLLQHVREGRKRVTVVCPGFATDCLETLEEIALRNRATFLEAGGESYSYVPALNATAAQLNILHEILDMHMHGWPRRERSSEERSQALARAVSFGATR